MQNNTKERAPMTSAPLNRRAFSLVEVAEILGCHKASVYRAVYAGKLKTLAGFGRNPVSDAELDRFLGATKN